MGCLGGKNIRLPVETAETCAADQNNELPKAGRVHVHARDDKRPAMRASQLRNAARSRTDSTSTWPQAR
jgi:hypothetical protein